MPLDPRIPLMGNIYQPDFGEIAQNRAQSMNVLSQMRQRDQELAQQNQFAEYVKGGGLKNNPLGALPFGEAGQQALSALTNYEQMKTAQDKAAREAEEATQKRRAEGRARAAAFFLNSAGTPEDLQQSNVIARQYDIDDDEIEQTNSWIASQEDPKQALRVLALTDENIRKAMEAVAPKIEKVDAGNEWIFRDVSPMSLTFNQNLGRIGKEASPDAIIAATTAANAQANQLVIAQMREEGANQRAVQARSADKEEKAQLTKQNAVTAANQALDSVNEAMKLIGFGEGGLLGVVGSLVPGTKSYALASGHYDTIKAVLSQTRLAEIRQASPTGAALGSVSDYENRLLGSSVAALNIGLKPEQQQRALRKIYSALDNLIKLNSDEQPIPRVTNDAEAAKLKSGDLFYDGDFYLRRMP